MYEEMLPDRRWDKSVLFLISDREPVKKEMPLRDKKRPGKALQGNRKYKDTLPAFQERLY